MFFIWSSALQSLKILTLFQKFSFQLIYIFMVYQHLKKIWIHFFPHFFRKWSWILSDRKKDYQQKHIPWEVFLFFHYLLLRIFPVVLVYFAPFWFVCNGGETLNNLFFLRGKIALLDKLREKAYKDGFFKKVFCQINNEMYTFSITKEEWRLFSSHIVFGKQNQLPVILLRNYLISKTWYGCKQGKLFRSSCCLWLTQNLSPLQRKPLDIDT